MSMFGTALLLLAMQVSTLQGFVFKKGTNEPLSDATVELKQDQANGSTLQKLTTEDDGRFAFDNVAPGGYRIVVSRRGYARPPLSITVRAGQPNPEIQLPMPQAGTISGRVSDMNGQPLGNIEVLALKASYSEGRRSLTAVQSVVTNDLGEYRLFWLAPGRYYVSAIHPKAQSMFRQMFSGFGIGVAGTSIGGMFHSVAKSDPALTTPEPESESERYAPVFFGGTTDEQSAAAIDIRAGTEASAANITVAPVRLRHVRGVVVDGLTGRPAQYGSLSMPSEMDGPRGKEFEVDRERSTFDILLPPGLHTLNATSSSGEGSVTFQVLDFDVENLAVPTTPTFDISGHISLEGESNAAALGNARITLRRDPPTEPSSGRFSYSSPLPNGSFVVGASSGDYRLNIELPPGLQNAYVKSVRLGNTDVLNGPLHFDGKPSAQFEVVIGKNPGAIDGQVVADRQTSVADVSVVLVPDNRRRTELYRATTTDLSGQFHFDRVPPGNYRVFSWEDVVDGAWYDPEFLRTNENRGTPIRVIDGRSENVRINVIP